MLFITRKIGERIIINDDITLEVAGVQGKNVKLAFDYPKSATIFREELYKKIAEKNRQAQENFRELKEALTKMMFEGQK